MITDIPGQFRNLCPSYSRCIDLTPEQMLEIVEGQLAQCRTLANPQGKQHWAYQGPVRTQGLIELRDALLGGAETERVAA